MDTRQETRDEDRQLLERFAFRYFPERLKLTELTPSIVANLVGWLCDPKEQANNAHRIDVEQARAEGKPEPKPFANDTTHVLSDSSVRNALTPRRAGASRPTRGPDPP